LSLSIQADKIRLVRSPARCLGIGNSPELKELLMTDSAQPAPQDCNPDSQPVSEAVREAVESGENVQERVRKIVVNLFRAGETSTAAARAAVNGLVQSAADIVKRSAPQNEDSVLRSVIDGVTEGLNTVAQSTQYAVQEAATRGQRFATEDLDKAKKNLNGISDILKDTVKYFTNRVSEESSTTFRDLRTHAERAAAAVTPAVKASMEAVAKHPVQTATEAAGTAFRGGQLTAGALLSAMSGALAGAAEFMDPSRRRASGTSADPTESPVSPTGPACDSSPDQKDQAL
jgi:polyhydroxyalkanoate synthesis regulator phasin